ncbi:muconolactone Delta-isomerase family protein [Nocardioides sp. URHA0032]|uniref:muconolactone Delta-isomerase family protein n=1 Tax=Nocardioides sp. URHA0032 TaxID=1380388 RepID=UPI0004905EDA|nr:muconolactone Delta-isomerase family protein [Nocardioides sp. URHA0032]
MEFLVTMTTQVPNGVSDRDVARMREREAARTADLVLEGRVRRLWRPPVRPGQWRTLGLFVADDSEQLEQILASMPLRIWRTDEVTALGPHPNDPGPARTTVDPTGTEFLTTFVVTVPPGTSPDLVETVTAREADRARELARDGRLVRLWTLQSPARVLGQWQAPDSAAMGAILRSLPMRDWLAVDTVPLTRHPSDPASTAAPGAPVRTPR